MSLVIAAMSRLASRTPAACSALPAAMIVCRLLLADLAAGEVGALQLPGDHRLRQPGGGDQRGVQFGRMGERPFAGGFVGGEHAADDVRMGGGEVLADVQHAPGVVCRVAVEQAGAVFDLGGGHHRVEAGPGGDVAANASRCGRRRCCSRTSLTSFSDMPAIGERADQEDVRIGAAGDRDALAFQVGDGLDRAFRLGDQGGPFRLRIDVDRSGSGCR